MKAISTERQSEAGDLPQTGANLALFFIYLLSGFLGARAFMEMLPHVFALTQPPAWTYPTGLLSMLIYATSFPVMRHQERADARRVLHAEQVKRARAYLAEQAGDKPYSGDYQGPLAAEIEAGFKGLEHRLGEALAARDVLAAKTAEIRAELFKIDALSPQLKDQAALQDLRGAEANYGRQLDALAPELLRAETRVDALSAQAKALAEATRKLRVRREVDRLKAASLGSALAPASLHAPQGDGVQELLDVIEGYLESFQGDSEDRTVSTFRQRTLRPDGSRS